MKSLFANCMLPVGMNKIFLNIATIVLMSAIFTACLKVPLTNPNNGGKYYGVYNFSFVTSTPSGNQTIVLPSGFFIVKNGVISSSDNTLSGTVLDDFGCSCCTKGWAWQLYLPNRRYNPYLESLQW